MGVRTAGDAWVYVDDKLVIDGGSAAGQMSLNGLITDGSVILGNNARVDVAPGSTGSGSGWTFRGGARGS